MTAPRRSSAKGCRSAMSMRGSMHTTGRQSHRHLYLSAAEKSYSNRLPAALCHYCRSQSQDCESARCAVYRQSRGRPPSRLTRCQGRGTGRDGCKCRHRPSLSRRRGRMCRLRDSRLRVPERQMSGGCRCCNYNMYPTKISFSDSSEAVFLSALSFLTRRHSRCRRHNSSPEPQPPRAGRRPLSRAADV